METATKHAGYYVTRVSTPGVSHKASADRQSSVNSSDVATGLAPLDSFSADGSKNLKMNVVW